MATRVQFPYAFDENKNLVFIEDIDKERRHDHTYTCPDCGHPMLPRLGEKNAKHFYHSENQSCGEESYIHAVAKRILADRFNDRSKPFNVKFDVSCVCKKKDTCEHFDPNCCQAWKVEEYDLHSEYDLQAKEEVWIKAFADKAFQPDVILRSSSDKHKPIFLEVYYKHKSSREKLESGQHIIEIQVKDFSDLLELNSLTIEKSEKIAFYNFKGRKVSPEFFRKDAEKLVANNAYKLDDLLPFCLKSEVGKKKALGLCRVILYPNGRTYWLYDPSEYDELSHLPYALADITFTRSKVSYSFNAVDVLIAHLPRHMRSCRFCRHSICNNDETNRWCELVKNGSLRKGTFDESKGQRCSFFERDTQPDPSDSPFYTVWINPKFNKGSK